MRYQFYFCRSLVSPKGTSFRLHMLQLWCCQGIPGTPAFNRAWGLTQLACLCNAVIFFKYKRLLYSGTCSNHSEGKKNTAMPVPLPVSLEQDTHILEWGVLCSLFFITSVPLQLWVAIGIKVSFGATWLV